MQGCSSCGLGAGLAQACPLAAVAPAVLGLPGASWAGGRIAPPLPSSRGLLPVPVFYFKDMSYIELGTAPLHQELVLTSHICRDPTLNEATSSGAGVRASACCSLGTQFNPFTSVKHLPQVLRDICLKWLLNEKGSGFLAPFGHFSAAVPCEL